jgi:Sap, sulfolipid-1-addressing protein
MCDPAVASPGSTDRSDQGPKPCSRGSRGSRRAAALGTGIALGIGGPKRLGLTLIVAAAISAAALGSASELSLVAVYVLVATVLVWVPVTLYVLFGTRATDWIDGAQAWVSQHQQPLTFYPSLVVGLGLTADALVRLL